MNDCSVKTGGGPRKKSASAAFLLALLIAANPGGAGVGAAFATDGPLSVGTVSVRVEANGLGTREGTGGIGTALAETYVDMGALQGGAGDVTAEMAINHALATEGKGPVEYDSSQFIVTVGGVAMPRSGCYWKAYLNDAPGLEGIGTQKVAAGDRVVLCLTPMDAAYNELIEYAFFKTADMSYDNSGAYPSAIARLQLRAMDAAGAVAPLAGATVRCDAPWPMSGTTDSANGMVSFELYPSVVGGESAFDFYFEGEGYSRAFCRISVATDESGAIVGMSSSQPVSRDTGLASFNMKFPGMDGQNGLNAMGDVPMRLGDVAEVSVSAEASDPAAELRLRHKESGGGFTDVGAWTGAAPLTVLPLAVGENVIEIIVTNGGDSRTHLLKLVRAVADGDALSAAAGIMAGIEAVPEDIAASYSLADWALGFRASGATFPEEAKTAFLTAALNNMPPAPGSRAKLALALTALNIDARMVPDKKNGGVALDLVGMALSSAAVGFEGLSPSSDMPFLLLLLDLGVYDADGAADLRARLIEGMLESQAADGSFGGPADHTALILPALAAYYGARGAVNGVTSEDCGRITAAVDMALDYISRQQMADGGFDGSYGRNSNTTSVVMIGLSALGVDSHGDPRFVKSGRSLADHLLTFRTPEGRLAYLGGGAYNDYASTQGYQALAAWRNVKARGNGNIYNFAAQPTPYPNWPDADLLTSIIVTPPTKLNYRVGESLDVSGMRVVAEFNGDKNNRKELALADCVVSAPEVFSAAGVFTVGVSYKSAHRATFVVTVSDGSGGGPAVSTVRISVSDHTGRQLALDAGMVVEPGVTSVLDALKRLLGASGISYTLDGKDYVSMIDGLGEFAKGPNSGWIYLIDGRDPVISASSYKLRGGENVQWRYTLDYVKEPGSANFSGSGGPGASEAVATAAAVTAGAVSGAAAGLAEADIRAFRDYDDISAWARPYVGRLLALGALSGRGDGNFDPKAHVSRAEFVKMLTSALGVRARGEARSFRDVGAGDWFRPFVDAASSNGITDGVGQDEFAPREYIARQDICVMSFRAMAVLEADGSPVASGEGAGQAGSDAGTGAAEFTDSTLVGNYAREAVRALKALGVIGGRPDGGFYPNAYATREEAAKIVCGVMEATSI